MTTPSVPGEERHEGANPRDWDAATYDRVADPMTRWGLQVLERLDLKGDETVMDAGCGTGRVTAMLLDRLPAGRVVALDAAPSMLETAREQLAAYASRVTFLEADLLELDLRMLDGLAPLDAVLSTATFHWVLDHDRLFANLAKILREGGQLVAQCGAATNIDGLMAAVRRTGNERAGIWNYATVDDTVSRLEASGFTDVDVWTNPEPTRLDPGEPLLTYLETVCLRSHVAAMGETERREFLRRVADEMEEPVIDYVRLNIVARRSSSR